MVCGVQPKVVETRAWGNAPKGRGEILTFVRMTDY